ncbi:hypothetical protein F8S20_17130, partial [Nostoc sp. BAE]|nr:hypothetical protein [Nostoc commune BAE]
MDLYLLLQNNLVSPLKNGKTFEEEFRSQNSGVRIQESEFRSQNSGVRIQESEFRSQNSGVRIQ